MKSIDEKIGLFGKDYYYTCIKLRQNNRANCKNCKNYMFGSTKKCKLKRRYFNEY